MCQVLVLSRWRQDLRYGDSKPAVLYTEIKINVDTQVFASMWKNKVFIVDIKHYNKMKYLIENHYLYTLSNETETCRGYEG